MSFFEDLRTFQALSEEQLAAYVQYANSREPNGSKEYVLFEKLTKESGISEETGRAINRVIGFLADFIISEKTTDGGLLGFESEFRAFLDSDAVANSAWARIKELVKNRKLEPFIVYRKEQRLKGQVPHLHQFSLVCDARPIFDLDRQKISKFLFPIFLKLEDHDDKISLYELEEEDLVRLKKEVDAALLKVQLLRESINVGR